MARLLQLDEQGSNREGATGSRTFFVPPAARGDTIPFCPMFLNILGESEDMNTRSFNTLLNGPMLLGALIGASALLQSLPLQASDIANVRIINASGEEGVEVDLDSLAVGESRQLSSSSGKPAVVTRTESGLSIEVAGKTTEVMLADGAHAGLWHADAGDGKVKIIELDDDTLHHADGDEHHERKMVFIHKGDENSALSDDEIAALIVDAEQAADGSVEPGKDKIIVTRKVIHEVKQD